jgi:hypothetical protein
MYFLVTDKNNIVHNSSFLVDQILLFLGHDS